MASDPKTCLALVESLENGTGWSTESATETMVATVKDDVISYQGPQDLLRLLGPIDSEEKAALLARSTGRELACGYGPVREIEGGYRLTTRRFGCVETVHVTTEGRIIDNAEPTADFGPCPSAVDAGFVDTGVSIDTGPFDTGVFDTGAVTTLDSTTVDSAGPDDGPAVDAGGE